MFSLDALFCHVDDFCEKFEAQWHKNLLKHGNIDDRKPIPDFCFLVKRCTGKVATVGTKDAARPAD